MTKGFVYTIMNPLESTYGELTEDGLKTIMKGVSKKGKVFGDIGSGKGRVVVAAATLFPSLKKIVGIEIADRHRDAKKAVSGNLVPSRRRKIHLVTGDMFEQDFGKMNIVYVSNLCFSEDTNTRLSDKINREMLGGSVVFTSKPLMFTRPVRASLVHGVKQSWNENSSVHKYVLL